MLLTEVPQVRTVAKQCDGSKTFNDHAFFIRFNTMSSVCEYKPAQKMDATNTSFDGCEST